MSHSAALLLGGTALVATALLRRSGGLRCAHTRAAGSPTPPGGASSTPQAGPGQIVNKYGDVEDEANLRVADWARRWEKGQTGWHKAEPNPVLVKYAPTLRAAAALASRGPSSASGSAAASPPTVLVPLCGKSVDLVWLYEAGYRVVGVEIVTQAIIDFFYEHAAQFPSFRAEKIAGTNVYRYTAGQDDRLVIVQADIFSPQLAAVVKEDGARPPVDAVWDRASLVAINPHQRDQYVSQILSLCGPHTQILLNVFSYDQSLMHGPPFSVPAAAVDALFPSSKGYTRKLLDSSSFALDGAPQRAQVPAMSQNYLIEKQQ